jgi:hypothetical protein
MVRFLCFLLTIGMIAHGSEREKDVYAIYSLMLTNPDTSFGEDTNERYLIAAATIAPPRQQPCVRPPEEREPDFREVLADYERRKTTPRLLTRRLSIPKPYELLSESDVKAFEQERAVPGTQVPDAKFRGVRNLFYVTDVYFNKRRTMALGPESIRCVEICVRWTNGKCSRNWIPASGRSARGSPAGKCPGTSPGQLTPPPARTNTPRASAPRHPCPAPSDSSTQSRSIHRGHAPHCRAPVRNAPPAAVPDRP